jgi:hypothetical protein
MMYRYGQKDRYVFILRHRNIHYKIPREEHPLIYEGFS